MPGTSRGQRSRRKSKTARWIVFAIVLSSGMSCVAPVLYASTDCSRWLAEYKQGVLQRRAARRLRAAKFRLTAMVRPPEPAHPHPLRHRMSPLESLRRFQIDCGDLTAPETPENEAVVPPVPLEPVVAFVDLGEEPPTLPPPAEPLLAVVSEVPPLTNVPVTPIDTLPPTTSPTPEPGSLLLLVTGAIAGAELVRRRSKNNNAALHVA